MGTCDSTNNDRQKDSNQNIIPETIISNNPLNKLDLSVIKSAKSLCKIVISPNKLSSGFLIKLFKNNTEFYCLMTNEHAITKEMIEQKKKIDVYYDSESKLIEIQLNNNERFIKEFTDIKMDITVIEILSKDNIPQDYFLLTYIDYINNYNKLINEDITIIQYPKGELNYSYGKINELTNRTEYEFTHNASTEKGSSGSPIFLKGSSKVIGIHKGSIGTELKKENYGEFIYPIFNYFKNYNSNDYR